MITRDEVFKIGRMGRPHGLRGEMDFRFTDDVFDQTDADYIVCDVEGLLVPFFIEEYRFRTDDQAIIKLEGLDNDDKARLLQGADVYFPRSLATQRDDEMVSWQALTGFDVLDVSAGHLGTVARVDESSANTLLEIVTDQQTDLLLPVHPDLVEQLDMQQRTLTLRLPEGLLSLNQPQ